MTDPVKSGAQYADDGNLVPVDGSKHKGLIVDQQKCREFASHLNTVPVNIIEFFHVQRDYPIVFAHVDGYGFMPCAVTGLKNGHNLFISADSVWDENSYVPAFVRRYPFVTSALADDKQAEQNQAVLVYEQALCVGDAPLFDEKGEATEIWAEYDTFLSEYVVAEIRTKQFADTLQRLNLLEPFEAHVHPKTAEQVRLTGQFRVNEDKLNNLSGDAIKQLMQSGELSRIYAHLISLENFAKLLDRSAGT